MDRIKAQLLKIQQQLAGLSATQKMLTASLVAIMLITLVWWAKSAGTSDLEPVFTQSMDSGEAEKAVRNLSSQGINANLSSSGQIMVPSDQKQAAATALAYSGAVPDGDNSVKELLSLIGPFDGPQKIQLTQDAELENRLGQVFKHFPGVTSAVVILDTKTDNRIGVDSEPTASVVLTTRSGEANPKQLTSAVSNTVCHAVHGMTSKNVGVDINGQKQRTDDSTDDLASDDAERRVLTFEEEYESKLKKIVLPGSLVAIKAELDEITTHTETHAGNPETTVVKEKRNESETSETKSINAAAAEPGAVPNSAVALPTNTASAAPTIVTSTEKTSSDNEVYVGRTETLSDKLRGGVHIKTAAVRLPMSAFIAHFKALHSGNQTPTEAQLDELAKAEITRSTPIVAAALHLEGADRVAIDTFYDLQTTTEPQPEVAAIAPTSLMTGYGKQAILGLLAVASLFMVATMVKKGTPLPALPVAPPPIRERGPMTLSAMGELAGIASDESSGTLEGVELDEHQMKTTRVVEQVSNLVKENPEAAADLVKRWMSRA